MPRGPSSTRVVIGEEETLTREGLVLMLERASFEVVGTAEDAESLVSLALAEQPEVLITEARMPPHHTDDGLQAARTIRRELPTMAVVLLTRHLHRRYAVDLLAENPTKVGYFIKDRVVDVDDFCADVRRISAGGTVLDPAVMSAMVSRTQRPSDELEHLTPRQAEVLSMIARGHSNAAIARRLGVSEKAIVRHISHIYDELGLPPNPDDHRRVLAAVRYLMR